MPVSRCTFPPRFRLAAALVVSMLSWFISTAALASPSPNVEAPPRPTAAEALDRQRPAGVSDDIWLALRSAVLESKLTPPDGYLNDRFGFSVSLSGNWALIGALGDDRVGTNAGAAYTFELVNGSWARRSVLTAQDAAPGDTFGWSVSLAGDQALIGAPGKNGRTGAAYVFRRNDRVWTQVEKFQPSTAGEHRFGTSVSLERLRAVIGAPRPEDGAGAAYVYDRGGSTNPIWWLDAMLTATDGAAGNSFGQAVSLDGNRVLIGAPGTHGGAGGNSGAAYVFDRAGSWNQTARLNASGGGANDRFGGSVSLDGNRALIGAAGADGGGGLNSGAVYVFDAYGSNWYQTSRLTASDPAPHGSFGISVSLNGNQALIGATHVEQIGSSFNDLGAAYLFKHYGHLWSQVGRLSASDGVVEDWFGHSVILRGDRALIGASRAPSDNAERSGVAYVLALADTAANGAPLLFADFQDKPLNQPIGNGGAAAGEPVQIPAELDARVRGSVVTERRLLELSWADHALSRALARFHWLDEAEVDSGTVTVSLRLTPDRGGGFAVHLRESQTSEKRFGDLHLLVDGTAAISDASGDGELVFIPGFSWSYGRSYLLEWTYDLDAGRYDFSIDGVRHFEGRPHNVEQNGRGLGAALVGMHALSYPDSRLYLDDIFVTWSATNDIFADGFEAVPGLPSAR